MESDDPLLRDTGRGYCVVYKNRTLYAPEDPIGGAEARSSRTAIGEKTIVFVSSPLLFYGMETLLNRVPASSHILCVERDETLFARTSPFVPKKLVSDTRVTYIRTENAEVPAAVMRKMGMNRFRRVVPVTLSGGYGLYPDFYRKAIDILTAEIENFWKNRMTLIHMAPLWMANIFANLSYLHRSVPLSAFTTSKPVFVAGAGESIETSLGFLKANRDVFFLCAVDTALPVLSGAGIVPDVIVSLESQWANLHDFMSHTSSRIPLLCDITVSPLALRTMRGDISFFTSAFTELRVLDRLRETGLIPLSIPPLGSVGVAAVYLARLLTVAPVFFSGLDFAYVPGKTHARGAPSITDQHAASTRINPWAMFDRTMKRPLLTLSGKGGSAVRSDVVLAGYRDLLSVLLAEEKRVFDLGCAGLPTGAPHLSHDEALGMCKGWPDFSAGVTPTAQTERHPPVENLRVRAESFLAGESAILELFLRGISGSGGPESTGTDKGRSATRLSERESPPEWMLPADYVWVHFPDAHRADYSSPSFRRRAEASARRYLALIGKARESCREMMGKGED